MFDHGPTRASTGYREVNANAGRFEALHRWRPGLELRLLGELYLLAVTLVWNVMMAVFVAGLLFKDILKLPLMTLHVGVGLFLAWNVLSTWLNTSTYAIRDGHLRCTQRPIPKKFFMARDVDLGSVTSFRVAKRFFSHMYVVFAMLQSGEEVIVTDGFRKREPAEFLAQRFEAHRQLAESKRVRVYVQADSEE